MFDMHIWYKNLHFFFSKKPNEKTAFSIQFSCNRYYIVQADRKMDWIHLFSIAWLSALNRNWAPVQFGDNIKPGDLFLCPSALFKNLEFQKQMIYIFVFTYPSTYQVTKRSRFNPNGPFLDEIFDQCLIVFRLVNDII